VPTGWPCSYLQPCDHKAAWGPVLHEQYTRFFADALAAHATHS
jgi:hypothetical protein